MESRTFIGAPQLSREVRKRRRSANLTSSSPSEPSERSGSSMFFSESSSPSGSLSRSPAASMSSFFSEDLSYADFASSSESSFLAVTNSLFNYIKKRRKKRRTRRKSRSAEEVMFWSSVSFRDISKELGPENFKQSYRMSQQAFKLLLNNVRYLLHRPFKSGTDYRCSTVPPEVRLAVTLRILAGGHYADLMLAYRIEQSTVNSIFHAFCEALNRRLRLKGFPSTIEGLEEISRRFQTSRRGVNPLPGCVGALDGICIKIKKPRPHENPATFYCRKGFYAIPVLALVDSDYVFRFCSAVCTGSTHDALAFSVSGLKREIDRGILRGIFYIVGDEAYTGTEYLVVPVPNSTADFYEDNFNYFQSSLRMHIEQAFGMLVTRWRILRGGLEYSVKRNTSIIFLLMKLHNFIIEYDKSRSVVIYHLSRAEKDVIESDSNQCCHSSRAIAREFQSQTGEQPRDDGFLPPLRTSVGSKKRDRLVEIVKRKGRERPDIQLLPYIADVDTL